MVRNPYAAAAVANAERCREIAPNKGTEKAMTSGQGRFFDALAIPHGGNRAKALTAAAHQLTTPEIVELVRRLEADNDEKRAFFATAPAFFLANATRENAGPLGVLRRVLAKRG